MRLKGHDYFTTSNLVFDNIKNIKNKYNKNPVKVWSSNSTGVGKSTQIIQDAKEKKLAYIYFPIGGIIYRKDIINRLKHLEINGNNLTNYEIHIDIYDSNEETTIIIREFLFSLLILRCYSYGDSIFYLGYSPKIAVEVPSGFYDMKDKFILLKDYFENQILNLEQQHKLLELDNKEYNYNNSNKKISNIQLVTNILIMLENKTIETQIFDLEKNNKYYNLEICQQIIDKYFTLEKGNYYQKKAFINILAEQFRKFCKNVYLNPEIFLNISFKYILFYYMKLF